MKNNKKNAILIIAVVLVIGLVVNTTRVMSHAYFKTTKSFNVIQGKIPAKAKGDVGIAVLIDGEKSNNIPEKDSGYHFVGSECNNDAKATWNEISWNVSVNNLKKSGTVCELRFEKGDLTFNYGDGSLNTVARGCILSSETCQNLSGEEGYKNKVNVYYLETGKDVDISQNDENLYNSGNFNGNYYPVNGTIISSPIGIIKDNNSLVMKKGENELPIVPQTANNAIIYLNFNVFGRGPLNNLQIYLDDNYYTLKSALENKKIKPLVLIYTITNNTNNIGDNPTNLYNGGTLNGRYAYLRILFMLEGDVQIKGIKFNSGFELSRGDGHVTVQKIDNAILHLK